MSEYLEEWRDITGFEGYYKVSNLGQVASCEIKKGKCVRARKGRILKKYLDKNNHEHICFRVDCEKTRFVVSRLVASEFIRPLKEGEKVYHLDMINNNNKVDNLIIKSRIEKTFSRTTLQLIG